MVEHKSASGWIRALIDYACPVAFLVTLLITRDFQRATWVLVGASAIALALGLAIERRIAPVPAFAGLAALVFGTLTLVFHDKSFVKMKLTFVDAALGAALLGGLAFRRLPIKAIMGGALHLPDQAWRTLSIRYGLFFLVCAVANEVVWRTQSDARWAIFRLVLLAAAVVFAIAQTPYLMKHLGDGAAEVPPEPPDPGF